VEVELHFGSTEMRITNRGGRPIFFSLPYSALMNAEYHESRHARLFVRTTRYWLLLRGPQGGGVLLRLERERVGGIIAALEQRWGRQVVTTAPQEEEAQQ
jgi:hypothetical protein